MKAQMYKIKLTWLENGKEKNYVFGAVTGIKELLYWQKRIKALMACKVTGVAI